MRTRISSLMLLVVAGCTPANRDSMPSMDLPGSIAEYADAQLKITPLSSVAPFVGLKKPLPSLGISTKSGDFTFASFSTQRTPKVDYSNDEISFMLVVLPPAAIKSIVDTLAADAQFGLRVLPKSPAMSVRLVTAPPNSHHAEFFVDVEHAGRLAAVLTDASIGTPSFDACVHWENNVP